MRWLSHILARAAIACHTDFTHMVPQMYLQDLAEADAAKELIQGVQVRGCRHAMWSVCGSAAHKLPRNGSSADARN